MVVGVQLRPRSIDQDVFSRHDEKLGKVNLLEGRPTAKVRLRQEGVHQQAWADDDRWDNVRPGCVENREKQNTSAGERGFDGEKILYEMTYAISEADVGCDADADDENRIVWSRLVR